MNVQPAEELAKQIMLCSETAGVASETQTIDWIRSIQKEAYDEGYKQGHDHRAATAQYERYD